MRSAKRTSSASCSDSLRNPDSRLTDMPRPESPLPRTSQRNPIEVPFTLLLDESRTFERQLRAHFSRHPFAEAAQTHVLVAAVKVDCGNRRSPLLRGESQWLAFGI